MNDGTLSSDTAFSIGLMAGWLALVVFLVWPSHGCHDKSCRRLQSERDEYKK